ncbi:MAG: M20/M25/M40 family metallo-hydrolase [Bdellovibrio sp.]
MSVSGTRRGFRMGVRMGVRKRFRERLEMLMGRPLVERDLSFAKEDLPVSELQTLKAFCAIDSATLNKAGVSQLQGLVATQLQQLGFKLCTIKGEDRFGDLLIAERPGRQRSFVSLVTHTDTVLGNFRDFELNLEEGRAYGSGVIDNKGGVVVGLSALQRFLRKYPETEYGFRFICSPNEEMGSVGFTGIYSDLGRDSAFAFGLEPALDNGSIIHQRRGNRWYNITITGQSAHAGRSFGEHANAGHDAANRILKLAGLTNFKQHMSVNVGHIQGGQDRHNIVCGEVHIKLDVRFSSFESRDYLHRKIEKILSAPADMALVGNLNTQTKFEIVDDCPPFSLTRRSRGLSRTYAALISRAEGRKVLAQMAGGAGDVNYLSTADNCVLDGFGPVGGRMHTRFEFVEVETLKSRAQTLAGFLLHVQSLKVL